MAERSRSQLTQSTKERMTTNNHEYFEELEIQHHHITYYVNGHVTYNITESIGGSYEGYAYEVLYQREVCHITITDLWYVDADTGESIDMEGHIIYNEIEQTAKEAILYRFE